MLSLKELCYKTMTYNKIRITNFPDLEDIIKTYNTLWCLSCWNYVGNEGLTNKIYHDQNCIWDVNSKCFCCNKLIHCNNKEQLKTYINRTTIHICSRYCINLYKYPFLVSNCLNCNS